MTKVDLTDLGSWFVSVDEYSGFLKPNDYEVYISFGDTEPYNRFEDDYLDEKQIPKELINSPLERCSDPAPLPNPSPVPYRSAVAHRLGAHPRPLVSKRSGAQNNKPSAAGHRVSRNTLDFDWR